MDDQQRTLNLILAKLETLEKKIDVLSGQLNNCEETCKNMDEHITFVEQTYTTLRSPLDYVRSRFSYLTGTKSDPLPRLEDEDSLQLEN
jgi:peptidoglycan hydrolase CwlO-like protein